MRPADSAQGDPDAATARAPEADGPAEGTAGGRARTRVEQAREGVEEARRKVEETKRRVEETKRRVEEAAPRHAALDATLRSLRTDRALGGSLLGGAMAFRLFLWIVPAALVIVGGLGLTGTEGDPSEVARDVGLSAYLADSIAQNTTTGSIVTLAVGLAGLWWGGLGAYKALRTIHQLAWRLPVTPARGAWKGGLWFTVVTFAAVVAGGLVNRLRADAPGIGLAFTLLFVLVYAGVSFWASLKLPHGDVPGRALVPGALLFGVGVEVLHIATVLYFAGRIAHASDIYGPLGVAIGLLAWLYVVGRLTVAAPLLNATLARRDRAGTAAASSGRS